MLQIKSLTIEHRRDLRVILETFNLALRSSGFSTRRSRRDFACHRISFTGNSTWTRSPGTVISISHDRKYIDKVCTRVLRLTETGPVSAPEFGKQD